MRNVYKYNHNLHHNHQRSTNFLPMLCSRPSIKDVHLPRWHNSSYAAAAAAADPSSPKVSCMGQVKRSNRVIGFPTTTSTSTAASTVNYHKLKKIFSGKNFPTTTTAAAAAATTTGNRGRSGPKLSYNDCGNYFAPVNVAELDPPLPVVKRPDNGGDGVNLWKRRRSGGGALRNLQIQQIDIPNNTHCVVQPIATV